MRFDKHPVLLCLIGASLVGIYIWNISEPPPYGPPGQEANMFWTQLIYIAHQWRSLHFSFWEQGVGGGLSTFTSCQFPVLNPLNAAAWVLNDDQFCIFHLLMPYVVGFFFTSLLLIEIFQVSWVFAFFGALYYLGIPLASRTILPESPLTLWGCFLLPGAIYVYFKWVKSNFVLAWALVGAFLSFHFASSGATTFPQNFVWWICFLTLTFLMDLKKKTFWANALEKLGALALMTFMTVGLFALQFIPLQKFVSQESGRRLNTYALDNFPLSEVGEIFAKTVVPNGFNPQIIFAMVCLGLALLWGFSRGAFKNIKNFSYIAIIFLTTALYIVLPYIIGFLSHIEVFSKLLAPLKMFTFRYAINTLDFALILTLTVLLNAVARHKLPAKFQALCEIMALVVMGVALCVMAQVAFLGSGSMTFMFWYYFVMRFFYVLLFLLVAAIVIYQSIEQRFQWPLRTFQAGLIIVAFFAFVDCFNWSGKGQRTELSQYNPATPEYQFFQKAKGQYFLPFDIPEAMGDCFPLVYDVYGTTGFYACPPARFSNFMASYHSDRLATGYVPVVHFEIINPAQSLTTYFPVQFTTTLRGKALPWSNFKKAVDGEQHDIWTRIDEPAQVLFASRLKVAPLSEIVAHFDSPFDHTIFVETADARRWDLPKVDRGLGRSEYHHWRSDRGRIEFDVTLDAETLVMVPTMFQLGWKAWIDGKRVHIFPANYIFIGLSVPSGDHHIVLKFQPPELMLGLVLNLAAIMVLLALILRRRPRPRP